MHWNRLPASRAALVSVLFLAAAAAAAPIADPYASAVPVEERSEQARAAAVQGVFARVLVKMTGQRDIAFEPSVAELITAAERFLQQYRYTQDGELWAAFDGSAVQAELLELGLPVWAPDRPATLVWLALDVAGGERRLIGSDDQSGVAAELQAVAEERGLPLVLPLLDSQDVTALSFSDVWGGFDEKIDAASARYRPDAVLVGRAVVRDGRAPFVRWHLTSGAGAQAWQGGLADGIDVAADFFASRFAVVGSGEQAVSVVVEGLGDLRAYGEVLNFLESLTLVRRVLVVEVDGETAAFELRAQGDAEKLAAAIALGAGLERLTEAGGGYRSYRYRYRP